MASHSGFSVPASETVSAPDVSAVNSSSSDQSTLLSMEQKRLKSPSGFTPVCTTPPSGYSAVHKAPQPSVASVSRPVTEQNVQLLSAPLAAAAPRNSHAGSVASSASKARRVLRARLAMELSEARLALADAEADLESNAGSVGRRLDDVRSDTGSSGPSQPAAAQESPFVGAFSSPVTVISSTTTPTAAPSILDVFSAGREVHILDQIGNLNAPNRSSASAETITRVSSASAGTPPGLSCLQSATRPPIASALSASAETTATDPSSYITVAGVHHGQKVIQAEEQLHVSDETGRGHKTWTQGSALPLHAAPSQLVPDDGGSKNITSAVSSITAHHGAKEHYIGDDLSCPPDARHFLSPSYVAGALSESSETRPGESRIRSAFPQLHSPDKGYNGWTLAKNSAGSSVVPADVRPDGAARPSSANGTTAGSPVLSPNMEVDMIGSAVFASCNTQNIVVNQTNIKNDSCVFGNVSHQTVANQTAVAVDATILVAEQRHSVVVAHHSSELEQANSVIKLFQDLTLRHQGEAAAYAAQASRLREMEIAYDIQTNELSTTVPYTHLTLPTNHPV